MATIGQVMTLEPVLCDQTDTVLAVTDLMNARHLGAVLVMGGGKLVGIFTERDLLERVVAHRCDPTTTRIAQVMTPDLTTVRPDTALRECAKILRVGGFRHLPVVDTAGQPVGILSSRDFFAFLAEGFERFVDQRLYERALADGRDPYEHVSDVYRAR